MSKALRFSLISIALLTVLFWRAAVAVASGASGGTWSVVTSVNPPGDDTLFAVAAVSAHDVWAVGSANQQTSMPRTLTEHWNGTNWSVIASPNPGNVSFNKLWGVTAISTSNVWAVGYYQSDSGVVQTLVEHWNGTSWSVVASPNSASTINQLFAVAAVSATDIWAVGTSQSNSNTIQTLTEHWNGSKWSVVASPNPGPSFTTLKGVAAVSSTSVWAVGGYNNQQGVRQTLTEHWNGSKWSVIASPNVGLGGSGLMGVTGVPGTSIMWAVGNYSNGSGGQTLVERWNGSKWSVVASPTIQANANFLSSVAVISTSDIWAVGQSGTPSGAQPGVAAASASNPAGKTLTEHWNGTNWSVVASPNPGTFNNGLNGVSRVPGTSHLWTVGAYNNGTPPVQTLIEYHP